MKKLISLLLACAMVLTMLTLPAGAVGTFADISDQDTAEHVEVLRTLGVLDGVSANSFNPNGTLTRSQFCKMAVAMMGQSGAVGQYQSFTIFPDVKADHWAAGYINLAVRGETKLLTGYPDGTFGPEDPITFGQAVTILMRLLGYTDSDVGAVWPTGYLNSAASNGLTDGLSLSGSATLTRAQAALLFFNLLSTNTKAGTPYSGTLAASTRTDIVLLSADATADDGTTGAVLTSGGTFKVADRQVSSLFEGRRGTLLLDAAGKVMTFLPDEGGSHKTITITSAKAGWIIDSAGNKLTLDANTVTYYQGEQTTYDKVFIDLRTGTPATIYYSAAGKAEYLFIGGSTTEDAVVIAADGSAAGLTSLTGGAAAFQIYKNGVKADASALRKYDVATYDQAARIVHISDNRLTGVYEDVYPSTDAPVRLTVLGHEFTVLSSAIDSLSAFKLGDPITLLLTADYQVAGAVSPDLVKNNSVGVVTSLSTTSATVELLNGLTLTGNPNLSSNAVSQLSGQLVTVSSAKAGRITLTRTLSSGATGVLDVAGRTVGDKALADNVMIYEQVGSRSSVASITLADLTRETVPADSIRYMRLNYAGQVDLLVLDDATGDQYTYGKLIFHDVTGSGSVWDTSNPTLAIENSKGTSATVTSSAGYKNGAFAGLVFTADGSRITGYVLLKQLKDVPNSAWTLTEDDTYTVTFQGVTYPVSKDIQCYNAITEKWITLTAARAFSDSADLYFDRDPDQGGKIRMIVVGD